MLGGNSVTGIVKRPTEVPPSGLQLIIGTAETSQQMPRAVIDEPPSDETVAPNVAVVFVISAEVGRVSVGTLSKVTVGSIAA